MLFEVPLSEEYQELVVDPIQELYSYHYYLQLFWFCLSDVDNAVVTQYIVLFS